MKIQISRSQMQMKIMGAWEKSRYALCSEILEDCNEIVKRQPDRVLLNSSYEHSKPEEGKLVWETPYARRQYWEIQTALTPGTSWKWCEVANRKHLQTWQKKAGEEFRKNL